MNEKKERLVYVGLKTVIAEPMTYGEHCADRRMGVQDDRVNDEGYQVTYVDGYVSWSPKVAFEEAYRLADGTPFGIALEQMKRGGRIYRKSWNALGQYVVFQAGYPDGIAINQNTSDATGIPRGTVCKFRPYMMLCTADGSFVPWAPTVSDVLAEDWHSTPIVLKSEG